MSESVQPGCLVQASPMHVLVGALPNTDPPIVILRIETVVGSLAFPLAPDAAESIGTQLIERARETRSPLIVPRLVPPWDQNR